MIMKTKTITIKTQKEQDKLDLLDDLTNYPDENLILSKH